MASNLLDGVVVIRILKMLSTKITDTELHGKIKNIHINQGIILI